MALGEVTVSAAFESRGFAGGREVDASSKRRRPEDEPELRHRGKLAVADVPSEPRDEAEHPASPLAKAPGDPRLRLDHWHDPRVAPRPRPVFTGGMVCSGTTPDRSGPRHDRRRRRVPGMMAVWEPRGGDIVDRGHRAEFGQNLAMSGARQTSLSCPSGATVGPGATFAASVLSSGSAGSAVLGSSVAVGSWGGVGLVMAPCKLRDRASLRQIADLRPGCGEGGGARQRGEVSGPGDPRMNPA